MKTLTRLRHPKLGIQGDLPAAVINRRLKRSKRVLAVGHPPKRIRDLKSGDGPRLNFVRRSETGFRIGETRQRDGELARLKIHDRQIQIAIGQLSR